MGDSKATAASCVRPLVGKLGEFVSDQFSRLNHQLISSNIFYDFQVLGLVGCTIENGDDITGARIVDKSNTM